jgi:Ala-tRNA(Pro) deacylase
MSVATRLKQYLDEHQVKYIACTHSQAFTAQEIAHSLHVKGRELAKAVILKADDRLVMAVVPAHHKVDIERFKAVVGARDVRLATEGEFKGVFPDCEIGAMPIFGNLYGVPVYVAEPLSRNEEIVFNAGTHTDSIRMKYADVARLVNPVVADFSEVS